MKTIKCDLCGKVCPHHEAMIIQLRNCDDELNDEIDVCPECVKAYVGWKQNIIEGGQQ